MGMLSLDGHTILASLHEEDIQQFAQHEAAIVGMAMAAGRSHSTMRDLKKNIDAFYSTLNAQEGDEFLRHFEPAFTQALEANGKTIAEHKQAKQGAETQKQWTTWAVYVLIAVAAYFIFMH